MRPVTKRVQADIVALLAIPKERRDADWRIAQGLLIEAALLVKANNDDMAEAMRQSAAPYLRFAEIV